MAKRELLSILEKRVYGVLSKHAAAMTAVQIARKLDVLPNTIYRASRRLIELGLVTKTKTYPAEFAARAAAEALPWYMLNARHRFKITVGQAGQKQAPAANSTTLTIVRNLDDFTRKVTQDAARAQHTVNLIVSGLEVPDETILTFRKIIMRGVKVRAIVQEREGTSPRRLEDWRDIGVEARYTSYAGLRLCIIDERVTYLVSYHKKNRKQGLGVRYDYPPLAASMNEFFEQKWSLAKPII